MKPHLALFVTALLALAAATPAQVGYTFDAGAGQALPVHLPSTSHPAGLALGLPSASLPQAALLTGNGIGGGGLAVDQTRGLIYVTDGSMLTVDHHPLYPPQGAAVGPTPVGSTLLGNRVVSGLAIDAAAGILYMADSESFGAFDANTLAPLGPAVLVPPSWPELVGIGWEPSSSTLWAICSHG